MGEDAGEWGAVWIGRTCNVYPDSTLTHPAPFFRKEFKVGRIVRRAEVKVCGLGFYEMYVNGQKVGDQVLAPAVTNYDRRHLGCLLYPHDDQSRQRCLYNTFDVTDMLHPGGANAIGIVLGNGWYNQRDRVVEGQMWYDDPKMVLRLEIEYADGSTQAVVSDTSWRTATGPILHDAIFTGEVYDARLELGDWAVAGYDDSGWVAPLAVRAPAGRLMQQPVPFNIVYPGPEPTFSRISECAASYALPVTISGWGELVLDNAAPGDTIVLRYISDEGIDYGQRDIYIAKGVPGESYSPRFTWHAFKSVEVAAPPAVTLAPASLRMQEVVTDIPVAGTFKCSNQLFNNICAAWHRTMRANFKGIISSDPHRERLAYTGDGQVVTESLLYTYDIDAMLRKFADDMADASNHVTGYVPHTAPFGGGGGGPAWGSAYVIVPWRHYCHYGDTAILASHYAGMKHWVEYLGTRTDSISGLVVREEPGGWCLGDWSTPNNNVVEIPAPLVNTAYYHHVASIMEDVAHVLGNDADAEVFACLSARIREDFNRAYYNPATGHYWEGRQGSDAIALGLGLVPPELRDSVFEAMCNRIEQNGCMFDTGIMATPLLLEVLTAGGRADLAYRLMDRRDFPGYGYLADPANNTLWETWSGLGDDNGTGHCHPMFGSVVAWLYRDLAGIRPDAAAPGMRRFVIAPHPAGDLMACTATHCTRYGEIVSSWRITPEGNFALSINVPNGSEAKVLVPEGWDGVAGETVLSAGRHEFLWHRVR